MNFKTIGGLFAVFIFLITSACSPHFHLDLFGTEQIKEVVLKPSPSKNKILVLNLKGFISSSIPTSVLKKEESPISQIYYRLEKASEDPRIKGVILRLDTPGGEVTATDIIYNEILNFREKTNLPVVALMMGVAASGGYYVASACDFIRDGSDRRRISVFASLSAWSFFIAVMSLLPKGSPWLLFTPGYFIGTVLLAGILAAYLMLNCHRTILDYIAGE